jgi:hypothetical protein
MGQNIKSILGIDGIWWDEEKKTVEIYHWTFGNSKKVMGEFNLMALDHTESDKKWEFHLLDDQNTVLKTTVWFVVDLPYL